MLSVTLVVNSERKSKIKDPSDIVFPFFSKPIMPAHIQIDARCHIVMIDKVAKPSNHTMKLRSHTLRDKQFRKLVKQLASTPVISLRR